MCIFVNIKKVTFSFLLIRNCHYSYNNNYRHLSIQNDRKNKKKMIKYKKTREFSSKIYKIIKMRKLSGLVIGKILLQKKCNTKD